MNYVSPQTNYFMEIWLSPALGFDFANHAARVFGDGNQATSFVSYVDVAKAAVASLGHPTVRNRMIPVGGLMLVLAKGLPMDMEPIIRELNLRLSSVEDYARKVMGN